MKYVIIGGGITGLLSAKLLRNRHPGAEITVLEKDGKLGGLLSGITYVENEVYFDTGTHIFQETGNTEIDNILLNSIDEKDLIHYPVGKGDIAGLFINNSLQNNSYFPDLRYGNVNNEVLKSVRRHINSGCVSVSFNPCDSLISSSSARFGKELTNLYISPIFEKVFEMSASELSAFTLSLTGWTRIILDDFQDWLSNTNNINYKSLVGVPDQRMLPLNMHHGRRSYYSRIKGSNSVIQGLERSLISENVEIITSANIQSINKISSNIYYTNNNIQSKKIHYDKLVISTGVFGAARLLGYDHCFKTLDRPLSHWIIDVVLKKQSESDLSYLYGLDKQSDWFRITNYNALLDSDHDKRITIEVLGSNNLDDYTVIKILKQLKHLSFIRDTTPRFFKYRKLSMGFPCPSTKNFIAMKNIYLELLNRCEKNILLCGIGTGNNVFFQNQVLLDMYENLDNL